jgi:ribosomal protein S14
MCETCRLQERMFSDVPSETETVQNELQCRICGKSGTVYFHRKTIAVCGKEATQHKAKCRSCGNELGCIYSSELQSEANSRVASLN